MYYHHLWGGDYLYTCFIVDLLLHCNDVGQNKMTENSEHPTMVVRQVELKDFIEAYQNLLQEQQCVLCDIYGLQKSKAVISKGEDLQEQQYFWGMNMIHRLEGSGPTKCLEEKFMDPFSNYELSSEPPSEFSENSLILFSFAIKKLEELRLPQCDSYIKEARQLYEFGQQILEKNQELTSTKRLRAKAKQEKAEKVKGAYI